MYRFPSQCPTVNRRPAETDTTVLVLGGILLILLLILAGAGGLIAWQWQRAELTRREAEIAVIEARHVAMEQEEAARRAHQQAEMRLQELIMEPREMELIVEPQPDPPVQSYLAAGELVTAPAAGPWQVLPLLPWGMEK